MSSLLPTIDIAYNINDNLITSITLEDLMSGNLFTMVNGARLGSITYVITHCVSSVEGTIGLYQLPK